MIEFIVFDLEASDKKLQEAQITQIGGITVCTPRDFSTCENEQPFCELVKCNNKICSESEAITGITNEMVQKASPLMDVMARFYQFLESSQDPQWERILVAYNGEKFDIPLLVHELRRNNVIDVVAYLRKWKITYFYDPFPVAKKVLDATRLPMNDQGLPCYKLTTLFKTFFHTDLEHAHDALADSKGLLRLVTELEPMRLALAADLQRSSPEFLTNLLTLVQQVRVIKRAQPPPSCFKSQFKKQKFVREFIVFEPWFSYLKTGVKTIEGRRGTLDDYIALLGNEIQFRNGHDSFLKKVIDVKHFDTIERFVDENPLANTLPGIETEEDAHKVYYTFWTKEKVKESGGMVAFYLA